MATKEAEKYKELGNEEFRKGNPGKAIEYYTFATELDPKNPIFFTNRSVCYYKMGNFAKSLKDALKAIANNKDFAKAYYRAAMAQMELGETNEALKNFQLAAEKEPNTAEYATKFKEAKASLMKDMSRAEIAKTEANDLYKSGKIDDALKMYSQALGLVKPNDPKDIKVKVDCLVNRALCYQQLYKHKDIVNDCTEALKLDPSNAKGLVRRAQAYEALEKYDSSLEDFNKASLLAPSMEAAYKGAIRVRGTMKNLGKI